MQGACGACGQGIAQPLHQVSCRSSGQLMLTHTPTLYPGGYLKPLRSLDWTRLNFPIGMTQVQVTNRYLGVYPWEYLCKQITCTQVPGA